MNDKTEERQMDYYPVPGMHVRDAAAALVVIAEARRETVRAEFNKVEMQANPGETAEQVTDRFVATLDAKAEAYRTSPEGIAAAEKQRQDREHRGQVLGDVLRALPAKFTSHQAALRWAIKYIHAADWGGDTQPDRVIRVLEASGYADSDLEGLPKEAYQDPVTMAKYAMGQVINMMIHGRTPHPMLAEFATFALVHLGPEGAAS